jgi:hypothetical protein
MKIYFFIFFCTISLHGFSQTKKIAFESHSGSGENFKISLNNDLFDNEESDFGGPALIIKKKIDSVMYISDTGLFLIGKTYDYGYGLTPAGTPAISPIKDTIYSSLLKGKRSADRVKSVLNEIWWGGSVTDSSTRFIGLEKEKVKQKSNKVKQQKHQTLPFIITGHSNNDHSPFDFQLLLMLGSLLLLSLLGGFLSWKFYRPRIQKQLV